MRFKVREWRASERHRAGVYQCRNITREPVLDVGLMRIPF